MPPSLSPLLRHFENVCVHIAYKGSMNRQAYAWYSNTDAHGATLSPRMRPDPPLFSRHVEFLHSEAEVRKVRPWWKPEDVNRTVGQLKYRTSASDLTSAPRPEQVIWLRNTTWWVDVSHGGTPNLWTNICHWSNSMFPVFEAASKGEVCHLPLQQIIAWQVPRATWDGMSRGYHSNLLSAVLAEYARVLTRTGHGSAASGMPRFFFDADASAGTTFCMEEAIIVREPNLQHRKLFLQTRSSMHTAGVARGFSTLDIRFAFRSAILRQLHVPPPSPRAPTVTYLSRPFGAKDAKIHGRAWQLRCHIRPATFRKLANTVFRQVGYKMVRAVFEKTTYAYQAQVISETDVFWASHGAGMVHLPLLPKDAVTIEMFNCGHFSYLYAQLALHVGVRYFLMQRVEPWCYKPGTMYGDTRKNMSKTYAYTYEEAEPVLLQAVRYHMWQDPGEALSGRESSCDFARKHLAATGTLPVGMLPIRFSKDCLPRVAGPSAADGGGGTSAGAGVPGVRVNGVVVGSKGGGGPAAALRSSSGGPSDEWTTNYGEQVRRGGRSRQPNRVVDPPEGDGLPGQWTRWAGLG